MSNEHDLFTGIINVIDQGQPTEDKDSVASALAAANERYENMRKDLVKCMNAVHEQNREMLETALEKTLGENPHINNKMEDETGKVSVLLTHMWRLLWPANSLGHQVGRRVFSEGPKLFQQCQIVLNYVQHIFPGGKREKFKGLSHLRAPPWLRA